MLAANEVQAEEYVVLGLATCYQRDPEGRLQPLQVIEPIPAAELDAIVSQARSTSYSLLYALSYGELVRGDQVQVPGVFPMGAVLGSSFLTRVQAAARSYRTKPNYRHLPLHTSCTPEAGPFPLHYHPEPKRILGETGKVSDADNVKQHPHTHRQL
ncbi:MAG: hypothetical protein Q6K99_05670 [Thermostichales cyanobacterium BF4_bins_65]